jgi:hypothetical protein
MTSPTFEHPTTEQLEELRDRTWALVYPETWKGGNTLIHARGRFKVVYDRNSCDVELWRKNDNDVYITKVKFRRPPYDGDWEEQFEYCITAAECLPELRALMVLDDLADA